ncbi:alpha-hydroxy acid oxidase [Pseudomonas fluorescens]|uniref:alpha-hydroxy acid oxidase n=1 Tax=Pseudomonas fluorescens TaxID=294 RepID=UPI003C17BDF0
MSSLLNFIDYRARARQRLPKALFEYIDRGSEDEQALLRIRSSLDQITLTPSLLNGVDQPELRTPLLGQALAMPLVIAPTALAGLVSFQGEIKLARTARDLGIPFCVSTQSVTTVEEIRKQVPDANLWFQLYVWKDRNLTRQLLERVQAAGVDTLVITADTPVSPKREYNVRNGFSIPLKPSLALLLDVLGHPSWLVSVWLRQWLASGMPSYGHYPAQFRAAVTQQTVHEAVRLENRLTWNDIRQIRSGWHGRLVIKGVLSPQDALLARDEGADAIVVSAHGGRNLDIAPAPIQVLPAIAEAVGGDLQIIADSGVTRGSDALKYLALGADAVMVGRLPLWGLAAAGQQGANDSLRMLRNEMELAMTLLGAHSVRDCRKANVLGRQRALFVKPSPGAYPEITA